MKAWIGIGSNLGDAKRNCEEAIQRLDAHESLNLLRASSLYRTPPWGDTDQGDFVNAVVEVQAALDAWALLDLLRTIEDAMGRVRDTRRWGPRIIDLDLLLYGADQLATGRLTVPHPRMHERAFVLAPMVELQADLAIPGHGTVSECLAKLDQEYERLPARRPAVPAGKTGSPRPAKK